MGERGREIAARFSVAEHARFMHRIYAGVIEERAPGASTHDGGCPGRLRPPPFLGQAGSGRFLAGGGAAFQSALVGPWRPCPLAPRRGCRARPSLERPGLAGDRADRPRRHRGREPWRIGGVDAARGVQRHPGARSRCSSGARILPAERPPDRVSDRCARFLALHDPRRPACGPPLAGADEDLGLHLPGLVARDARSQRVLLRHRTASRRPLRTRLPLLRAAPSAPAGRASPPKGHRHAHRDGRSGGGDLLRRADDHVALSVGCRALSISRR